MISPLASCVSAGQDGGVKTPMCNAKNERSKLAVRPHASSSPISTNDLVDSEVLLRNASTCVLRLAADITMKELHQNLRKGEARMMSGVITFQSVSAAVIAEPGKQHKRKSPSGARHAACFEMRKKKSFQSNLKVLMISMKSHNKQWYYA